MRVAELGRQILAHASQHWEVFVKKRERKEGMLMQSSPATMPYSKEALEALSRVLAVHQSFFWVNPETSQLAVKQIDQTEENSWLPDDE